MAQLRSHMIDGSKTTRLRVGIRWNPLERDDIGDAYGLESAVEARAELGAVRQHIKTTRLVGRFLRWTRVFGNRAAKIERSLDQSLGKEKAMEKYLSQEKLPSYDLDLCCFCYGRDGKLLKFVSPVSRETKDDLQKKPAFMHTGDATTGEVHAAVGGIFDEEILVDLTAIDSAIDTVFFVIVSVSHGFHQIKGGFWSIISTRDEDELLSTRMQTKEQHRIHVMAKLSRIQEMWSLEEISGYCPIDNNSKIALQHRIDQMITTHYPVTSA